MAATAADALAQNTEERLLLAKIQERAHITRERGYMTSTKFLSAQEAELAQRFMQAEHITNGIFFGGYDRAERQVLVFVPDWMPPEDMTNDPEFPVTAVRCTKHKEDTLSHRDYLGSLMGMGLRRDAIGDILVGEHGADVLVLREILPYLLYNYTQVGRKNISVSELPLNDLTIPEEKVSFMRDTVASMRLDSVVSAMFRISRAKAADAVRAGKVFVNQRECLRVDKEISVGDKVTLRGTGRGEVDEILGESKKGRLVVVFKRFG